MPGFIIGGIGQGPNHAIETRRKHRWLFETLDGVDDKKILTYLKEATRPHLVIEQSEVYHKQERIYLAGRHSWEPIKLVWYDVADEVDSSDAIWQWVNKVIDFFRDVGVPPPGSYKKNGRLIMLDGDGRTNENWEIFNCWPAEVNWNAVDYADSEIQTIEVTMRYDRAARFT
jgi:hypothetical protein